MSENAHLIGCYIDEANPRTPLEITEALIDILSTFDADAAEKFTYELANEYPEVPEVDQPQWLTETDRDIEDAINEALPDGLCAFWESGGFYIDEIDEAETGFGF